MRRADLVEYANRPWGEAARVEADSWAARHRRLGPSEGSRVAEELRRHVLALRPDWPSPEERAADLAAHCRLGEMLRSAAHLRSH